MATIDRPLLSTDLDGIFRPSSVAIYGISDRTSLRIAENMTVAGVPFYGINPTREEACGIRCYPSIGDCPAVPEMVVMGVGHGRIEDAIGDVLSVDGVRAVITPGLGNEAGAEGPPVSARVSERVRDAGIAMVGPNCMGVATPGAPSPWIGTLTEHFTGGPVATLAHSGSIGEILVSLGPRIGFRTVVSAGNETVTDVADMTAYFAEDPQCRVVGLFLETVRRPAAFEEALRRIAEAGKVAVVLKVGTSEMGARAALAHTGALVGSDRSFSAMLRYYNAIRCDDFGTWLEHLEVFSRATPPRGRRIGAVTNSGGEGEYFADKAEQAGIPLQPLSDELSAQDQAGVPELHRRRQPGGLLGDRRRPRRLPPRVPADGRVRRVRRAGVQHRPLELADRRRAGAGAEHRRRPPRRMRRHRPVPVRDHRDHGLPAGRGPALGPRARHPDAQGVAARAARPGLAAEPPAAGAARRATSSRPSRWRAPGRWPSSTRPRIAAAYGVPYVRAERCDTADAAVAAAERIGYPVVVKIDNVAHKARVGGVALNLLDASQVRDAAERMGGAVIVAEQVAGGVEVLVGMVRDQDYGPTVVVGIGGALAEALDLVTASLAPLDRDGARELVAGLPALTKLLGGEAPDGLIDAIVAVSRRWPPNIPRSRRSTSTPCWFHPSAPSRSTA